MDYPLTVEETQSIFINAITPLESKQLFFAESTGYILAENSIADQDIPLFDRAMMDGFAVRMEDTLHASATFPITLKVVEEVAAGEVPLKRIGAGEASRIMTGGVIPQGADAVCRFEATKEGFRRGVETVSVATHLKYGENIARQGEDMSKGSLVVTQGTRIGPAEIAVFAALGRREITVYRKPVVGILSTGSEIVGALEELQPGKIRNSNSYMLAALIEKAGGTARIYKPVSDHTQQLAKEIEAILPQVDVLVTTGGVSVGDYDFIPAVLEQLGAEMLATKVLMRPGSPLRFAMCGNVPFMGLSGNPAAAFVQAQLFVLPALRQMSGQREIGPRFTKAVLTSSVVKTMIKPTRYLRGTAYLEDGLLKASLAMGQSSGMISSLVGANCLVRIDGGTLPEVNSSVNILLYDEVLLQ